jgi:hypothetical protein
MQGPDVHFVTLEFTQRPPDDLIQILGSLLEANANSQRRRDERIIVTPETQKKLGLESREASVLVDGKSRKCVLRDLSFSGAKVVISGRARDFENRRVSLKFARSDQVPEMTIPAVVGRVDEVGGRKDILAVSMVYTSEPPMSYKLLINSYVSTIRKAAREAQKEPAPTPSPVPSPIPPADSTSGETPALDIPSEGDPSADADEKNPADG